MFVPEIIEIKDLLDSLKKKNLISAWELPYENLLTRRSAAIFFLEPTEEEALDKIWSELKKIENFSQRLNTEKKLSSLHYRITFSREEMEKNQKEAQQIETV